MTYLALGARKARVSQRRGPPAAPCRPRCCTNDRGRAWSLAWQSRRDRPPVRLGYTIGELLDGDGLFRCITPPLGTIRRLDDHQASVVDTGPDGRERVRIVYTGTAPGDRWQRPSQSAA
jgi:hypothetical protein